MPPERLQKVLAAAGVASRRASETLIAAGRIPDPFYAENETACAWIEEREWWYRLPLDIPSEPLDAEVLEHKKNA